MLSSSSNSFFSGSTSSAPVALENHGKSDFEKLSSQKLEKLSNAAIVIQKNTRIYLAKNQARGMFAPQEPTVAINKLDSEAVSRAIISKSTCCPRISLRRVPPVAIFGISSVSASPSSKIGDTATSQIGQLVDWLEESQNYPYLDGVMAVGVVSSLFNLSNLISHADEYELAEAVEGGTIGGLALLGFNYLMQAGIEAAGIETDGGMKHSAILIVAGITFAPIMEEIQFRGKLEPILEDMLFESGFFREHAHRRAKLTSSVLFGLTHMGNWVLGISSARDAAMQTVFATIAGIMLSEINERYGLLASIFAHFLNNSVATAVLMEWSALSKESAS